MTKSQFSLLGSLFVAGALVAAGCGGGGGGGGTGGATGTGGKGGSGSGGSGTGGKGGAAGGGMGGAAGNGAGGKADGGTTDSGSGGSTVDAKADTGPCTTSFGAGSRLLFSFDNGSNAGWTPDVTGVGYTFNGITNDGNSCPGAVALTVQFNAFGNPGEDISYGYGPAADWTGFSKVHAWVKLVTSTYAAVNGVQPFVQSNNYGSYANGGFVSGSTFSNGGWHELVLDLLHPGFASAPVVFNNINKLGIQILVNGSATDGGPAAPTDVQMLVDDIWLEPTPPAPDAGPDVSPDVPPAVDAPTDTTSPIDTGVDTTSG